MRTHLGGFVAALIVVASCGSAYGWSHTGYRGTASGGGGSWSASGYRGGSASGGDGSWNASGFRGGTASGGGGSWSGTGYRGGTASGGDGSWSAHGADGGYASGGGGSWQAHGADGGSAYGTHYYGGSYTAYHPPTTVNTYYEGGCYDCGGWNTAGAAAAGVAVGATLGAAATSAASSNAYAAGYAAGSSQYPIGSIYTTLPAGCTLSPAGGVSYYACGGGVWLSPGYGANGVYYRIVPAP